VDPDPDQEAQKHVDPVDPDPDLDLDPQHCLEAMLWIHDILVQIRLRGSVPLSNGS